MKKTIYLFLIIFNLLFIASCSSNSEDYGSQSLSQNNSNEVSAVLPEAEMTKYNITDFLPSAINSIYSFSRSQENEIIKEYIEFLKEGRVQVKSVSSSSIASLIYEIQEDALVLTYIAEDNYIKKELFDKEPNSQEILLMNPIIVGTTWNNGDKTLSITAIDIPVETKSGTYTSIEVTTKGKEFTQKDYYALNLGKIKTVFEMNGTVFTTELMDYKNYEIVQGIYRYYYNTPSGNELYYLEEKVSELREEELKERIIKNLYNAPRKDLLSLDSNIKINFIKYSPENDNVHIDFSFIINDKLDLETTFNKMFLKSLANTLCFNYGVENALITIDGKSQGSDQLILEDKEVITADFNNYKLLEKI
ncbi:GerMN domain-containing protein [Alloiococcus sp. CFN-8]|uniref:GerMN domain-containing protein n=1 Tax=Alloiococcus sp. CFN-8 TaxID=3416081 RepID=UPI003CF99B7F